METPNTLLLEKYFNQDLSAEDEKSLLLRLEKEDDLKAEYDLFIQSQKVVELVGRNNLKLRISQLDEKTSRSKRTPWMKIAASILILIVVGSTIYSNSMLSNEKIFTDSYAPAEDYITDLDDEMTPLEKAMEFYNKKQYQKAKEMFLKWGTATDENVIRFYLGQCDMQLGRWEEVEDNLTNLKIAPPYYWESRYYLALAQLKNKKEKAAETTLTDMIDKCDDEAFVIKARNLRRKISNPLRILIIK